MLQSDYLTWGEKLKFAKKLPQVVLMKDNFQFLPVAEWFQIYNSATQGYLKIVYRNLMKPLV